MEITSQFILKQLECPICFNYMQPPIPECIRGHNFCDLCFHKMSNCGMCREPLTRASRSLTLEALHAEVFIPCVNRSDGCPVVKRGQEIINHEACCMYGVKPCPLANEAGCHWVGEFSDMKDHLVEYHENVFNTSDSKTATSREYVYGSTKLCYAAEMYYEYDNLFKLMWDMNLDKSALRFCVFKLHHPARMEQFEFEIEMKCSDGRTLQFRRECPLLRQNISQVSQIEGYLLLDTDLLQNFVQDPELCFTITILKK